MVSSLSVDLTCQTYEMYHRGGKMLRSCALCCAVALSLALAASSEAATCSGKDAKKNGLPDKWEQKYKLKLSDKKGGKGDPDRDGLNNKEECKAGTNPNKADSERDGLKDGFEVKKSLTSPLKDDTDGDEVEDVAEDLDEDGLSNLGEQDTGLNPRKDDTDSDGIMDGCEDSDGDGMTNSGEEEIDLDPSDSDSDDDGLSDGEDDSDEDGSADGENDFACSGGDDDGGDDEEPGDDEPAE
jgi:hypothetical protein